MKTEFEREFEQLKRFAEEAKQTVMRETIKKERIDEEESNIYEELEEACKQPIKRVETAESIGDELTESIESYLTEYKKVLRELGYNI